MRLLPLSLILLPVTALADDFEETHFRRGFCYEMNLSQEDLLAAPERQVAAVQLKRDGMSSLVAPGNLAMEVTARFRGEIQLRGGEEVETTADCRPRGDGLRCLVADRGGVFTLQADGPGLRMTIDEEGLKFEDWRSSRRVSGEDGDPDRELSLRPCS
jgi:hypothetical protein